MVTMEPKMQVFLYSPKINGREKEIQRTMEDIFLSDRLEVIRSFDAFSQRLKEPWDEKPIAVVVACKKEDLLDLVSIREQLYPVRLILVLYDSEQETIALAHRLRPNFLTYFHRDIDELKAVLMKIKDSDGV